MSRVGEKIKIAREHSKVTQKQLAKKLGVAEKYIAEVEQGKKIVNDQLLHKISKVLGKDINDISMSFEAEVYREERTVEVKKSSKSKESGATDIWNKAFGDVLRNVPVYGEDLKTVRSYRELAVHSNKIDGFAQDKVYFLEVETDDMIGYRIKAGDIAFCHSIKELDNNSICFVEYNGKRVIRYIKKLDNTKVLLLSNKGDIRTETCNIKEITPLARLLKLEIKL